MKYLAGVATLRYDREKCRGCGMCAQVCPHGVFVMADGKAHITDKDLCMECGACALNCEFEAISVKSGVGCAVAFINAMVNGGEPNCDCGGGESSSCC